MDIRAHGCCSTLLIHTDIQRKYTSIAFSGGNSPHVCSFSYPQEDGNGSNNGLSRQI